MIEELVKQAEEDEEAREIRRAPAWVSDDLQGARSHRSAGRDFVAPHLVLVEGKAAVAQRVVHVDVDLALLALLRIGDEHAALEVFRNPLGILLRGRAWVDLVRGLEERDGERLIGALPPQRHAKGAPAGGDLLLIQPRRDEPRSFARARLDELDDRVGHIARIHVGPGRQRDDDGLGAARPSSPPWGNRPAWPACLCASARRRDASLPPPWRGCASAPRRPFQSCVSICVRKRVFSSAFSLRGELRLLRDFRRDLHQVALVRLADRLERRAPDHLAAGGFSGALGLGGQPLRRGVLRLERGERRRELAAGARQGRPRSQLAIRRVLLHAHDERKLRVRDLLFLLEQLPRNGNHLVAATCRSH